MQENFIIPHFSKFEEQIKEMFLDVQKIEKGKVADYIPELAKADPKKFGVSICTIDG